MAALTQDRKTDKLDTDDTVDARQVKYPVEAATSIWGGAMVAVDSLGNAVPAQVMVPGSSTLAQLRIVGRAERQCVNQTSGGTISPDGIGNGTAGSIKVRVRRGIFYYNINADSTIGGAQFGASVYASDDNTVSLSDAGGTRPYAGWVIDAGANQNPNSTQVGVALGFPNPYALNALLSSSSQFVARNVVTSLAAYTGSGTNVLTASANGAFGAQDGVTNVANDIVFIQGGTTNLTAAADAGPWQVTAVGGAGKWSLQRPDWFTSGSTCQLGQIVNVGGEGTAYFGTQWKAFATSGSQIVGTNDLKFYVGRITFSVTLVTGFVKLGASQTFPGLWSATLSGIEFTPTNFSGAGSTISYRTGAYASGGSATAAGYMGTSTVSVTALVAAGTFNTTDVSSGLITIINW